MCCVVESRDFVDVNVLELGGWINGDYLDERFCLESGVVYFMCFMCGSLNYVFK